MPVHNVSQGCFCDSHQVLDGKSHLEDLCEALGGWEVGIDGAACATSPKRPGSFWEQCSLWKQH